MASEKLQALWPALSEEIFRFRETVDRHRVCPLTSARELRELLAEQFPLDSAMSETDVIRGVSRILTDHNLHTCSPMYFGLFNPDALPMGVAADALVANFNPQLAAWSHSPAACEIERYTLRFFLPYLGFPSSASGTFTSGGQEANQSALLLALNRHFPSFAAEGIQSVPGKPTFYVSAESHHSFIKSARTCGLGTDSVRVTPVDGQLRMRTDKLIAQVQSDRDSGYKPFMVAATAGTTAAGAVDPLPQIAEVCAREDLWFHVDAAWGGAGLLSPKLSPLFTGIEGADSVTFDAHKWLSVPMGAGMLFYKDQEAAKTAFGVQTGYMPPKGEIPDPYHTSMQWSRRFIGLKVFMALATLGPEGYRKLIEHQAEMSELLTAELRRAGWLVKFASPLATLLFTHPDFESGKAALHDFINRVQQRGNAWISLATISSGSQYARACITNYRTQPEHVYALVKECMTCLAEVSG